MARPGHRPLLLIAAIFSLAGACVLTQPEPTPEEFANEVGTSVALTLTALPTEIIPTDTPAPTATEFVPPTETPTLPPTVPPTVTATARPEYACSIIDQRPFDDSTFERNGDFDVKWTLVNTGTQRWESGTYMEYLSGPRMTEVSRRELPRLRPREEYEVILDAAAPDELDRQVMVWAVYGPDEDDDGEYVLCYPYIRIIVER